LQIGADTNRIIVRFFDMITIAVPPALPACLTIATVFSIGRLRKRWVRQRRLAGGLQLGCLTIDAACLAAEAGLCQGLLLRAAAPGCWGVPVPVPRLARAAWPQGRVCDGARHHLGGRSAGCDLL
jgi:hypothetical protein